MGRLLLQPTSVLSSFRGSIQHSLCEVGMTSESTYMVRLVGWISVAGIIGLAIILCVF
jgi:hypothetical protein